MHEITGDTEYIDEYMVKHSSYDLGGAGGGGSQDTRLRTPTKGCEMGTRVKWKQRMERSRNMVTNPPKQEQPESLV